MRPMPELEIHELPVAQFVPYANNAKKHPQKQVDEIAASIEAFGNCDPIGVWHNERGEAEIVEGHGRVLALKKLGIETAPVIFLDHLTDETCSTPIPRAMFSETPCRQSALRCASALFG